MKPPYFSPSYSDIPPDLFKLFRRAFERGSERDNRPTAGEWVMGLQALQPKIINCNVDDGHNYWNGAGACPWCRLAKSGMEYYTGVASGTVSFNILDPKLQEVIRRLKAVERIHFPFKIESYRAAINPVGKRPLPEIEDQRSQEVEVNLSCSSIFYADGIQHGCRNSKFEVVRDANCRDRRFPGQRGADLSVRFVDRRELPAGTSAAASR